jgi:hypothetical protein
LAINKIVIVISYIHHNRINSGIKVFPTKQAKIVLEWLGQQIRPPISLSLEDVAVLVGHKVLMEVDDNSALI